MLATIRLSSGTGGTTVVGDGISVGHWNVGRWLVAVGSEDFVRVGVEGNVVGGESTGPGVQAPEPAMLKMARSIPNLERKPKESPLRKRDSPL